MRGEEAGGSLYREAVNKSSADSRGGIDRVRRESPTRASLRTTPSRQKERRSGRGFPRPPEEATGSVGRGELVIPRLFQVAKRVPMLAPVVLSLFVSACDGREGEIIAAETPVVDFQPTAAPDFTPEILPTEMVVVPTPTSEPVNLPDVSVMEKVAVDLRLGEWDLFSRGIFEVEASYTGGEGEEKVVSRFQELGARFEETEVSVGWNLVGAIPGALTFEGEGGEIKSYSLKGAELRVDQEGKKAFVEINEAVLREMMTTGKAQYVDQAGSVIGEIPIFVSPPEDLDPESQPRFTIVPSEEADKLPQLRVNWVGHYKEVLREQKPFSLFEGGSLTFDWEQGVYQDSQGRPIEGFGLMVPEKEGSAMVEVVGRQDVEAWWQAHGVKKDGQVLSVDIQEEAYLDDEGNEVRTFKLVRNGMVWMRVFANAPLKPSGILAGELELVESLPEELAARYRDAEGNTQVVFLGFFRTAEEERAGSKPILKTTIIRELGKRIRTVGVYQYGGEGTRPEETGINLHYDNETLLPGSVFDFKGRGFNDVLASEIPYAEREAFLEILSVWRETLIVEIPPNYTSDNEYLPDHLNHLRRNWGDLPHRLVEEALDSIVEAARRSPNLDSEKKRFFKDLVGEIRSIEIRGAWGQEDLPNLGWDTYNPYREIVYLSFYEDETGGSVLRVMAMRHLALPENDLDSKQVLYCLLMGRILHEAERGIYPDSQEDRLNYEQVFGFLSWLKRGPYKSEFEGANPGTKAAAESYLDGLKKLIEE